jgi:hypothetical protein
MSERNANLEHVEGPSVELSRAALAEFLTRNGDDDGRSATERRTPAYDGSDQSGHPADAPHSGWSSLASAGLSAWWDNHPLKAGVSVVTSSAEQYARQRPLQAISIAAAAGAALVVFRPWRLISATALVATVLKSSNLAGVAASLLDKAVQSSIKAR